jgi:hypothetical protein
MAAALLAAEMIMHGSSERATLAHSHFTSSPKKCTTMAFHQAPISKQMNIFFDAPPRNFANRFSYYERGNYHQVVNFLVQYRF